MKTSMRRRFSGYSPAAVAEAFRLSHEKHLEEIAQLQRELELAREKTAALNRQVSAAEAKAQSTTVLVHALVTRLQEWVFQRTGAVKTFIESKTLAEHELRAEIERLHTVFAHLEESQSRFGNELGGLMRRFRDEVASLRIGLPTASSAVPDAPTPTPGTTAAQPQSQSSSLFSGERKESAGR